MSKLILVVDDNEMNRKLLRVLLTSRGYAVMEAETGLQAIACAKESRPALALLDYRLPDINGAQIAQEMKKDPASAAIPVIIVTAIALTDEKERIKTESGCIDYITKPIDAHLLLEAVKKYAG